MSSRPWMPLYVADFRMDTLDLGADEVGVYMVLLMIAWQREDAAIPNDMAWLRRSLKASMAGFHGHQFNRIVPKLLSRYFSLGADDKWRNKRLTKERQTADKRSANGRQNSDKRWSETKENKNIADAKAMLSQSQSQREEDKVEIRERGKANSWSPARHGATSKKHGTVRIQTGTDEWSAYAEDYRMTHGGLDPVPDENGGKWFPVVGFQILPEPSRFRRN